jgi:hypothetical protein
MSTPNMVPITWVLVSEDRRSWQQLFDLYASLVAPAEKPRLESLFG